MTLREFFEYVPFIRIFVKSWHMPGVLQSQSRPKNKALAIFVELLSLFSLYCLLSPAIAMPVYNQLILHPISEKDDLTDQIDMIAKYFHCNFHEAMFKAPDGQTLHGWSFQHPGSKKTILVSHGNGGSIQHRLALCPLLLQSGASVFLYDYEGFGKSTGSPSLQCLVDDAAAAFDYLTTNMQVKPSNIVIYGESIGAGVTSELSTRRNAGGIILQSPFTSLPELGADRICFFKLYPDWMYPTRLSNIEIMSKPHAPLLIIHGKKDDALTYHYSERIMAQAAQPKTLVLLPGANHIDIFKTDVAVTVPVLNKFLASLPN